MVDNPVPVDADAYAVKTAAATKAGFMAEMLLRIVREKIEDGQ